MAALSLSGQTRQRQIVILAVGGVLLGGLLLFQLPKTLKMLNPPAAEEETVTTPVAPPPAVAPPVLPVATTPSATQLPSLVRFKSKDPFVQQINVNGGSTDGQSAASSEPAPSQTEAPPGASFSTGESSESRPAPNPPESATISVNGVEETVRPSATFPEENPVFSLVSLTSETAKVGIAGGKLKGGAQTVTLSEGEPLTLLNTVDGKRYKLELTGLHQG